MKKRPVRLTFTVVRIGKNNYFQIKFRGMTLNIDKFHAALMLYKQSSMIAKEDVTISYQGKNPKGKIVDIELYYHMSREDSYYFITKVNSGPPTQDEWLEANSFEEGDAIELTFLKDGNKGEVIALNVLWSHKFVIDKNYRNFLEDESFKKVRQSGSFLTYYIGFHFLLPKKNPVGPKGTLTLKAWDPKAAIQKKLEQINAQLVALLKPYKANLNFDKERRNIICSVKWKSSEGHKCSRGMGTWEEDGKLIAFRQGSENDHAPMTPKEVMAWLKSELSIYRHEILPS